MDDKTYLECGIPDWLKESIRNYQNAINTSLWDCLYCELQSDINVAEVEQFINEEQAWYLRTKYLGLKQGE